MLFVAEAAMRLLPSAGDGLRGLHQAELGAPWLYALRPGARSQLDASSNVVYEVNPDGYRGPVAPLQKLDDGRLRVLVLGDSVAFGYGVEEEETFARRLEATSDGADGMEVLNFGVGGYNPYNEAALFQAKGPPYHPDIVLVQFCINDLNDPTSHFDAQTSLELGRIPDAAFPDPAERADSAERASCVVHPCGCSRVCSAALGIVRRWTSSAAPLDAAALAPRNLTAGPSRQWIGDLYQEIATASHQIGARFAVVVFPYRDQAEAGASAEVQEQLSQLGRERGFAVIDLLPAFRAADTDEPLFLDLWHPTTAGHRVAAEEIGAQLQALGWIPARTVRR